MTVGGCDAPSFKNDLEPEMTSRWGDDPQTFAFAEYLIKWGVPVFLAQEEDEREGKRFQQPLEWQRTKPNMRALNRAKGSPRAGKYAVGAASGVECDYLDVDPRHGGDEALSKLEEMDVLPPTSGVYSTPSGGQHLWLPRSGCRSKHPKDTSPYYGLDFQMGSNPIEGDDGGRAYIYIPPTIKRGKTVEGGFTEPRTYKEIEPVDIQELRRNVHHPKMNVWREFLREEVGAKVRKPTPPVASLWKAGTPLTRRQEAFLDGSLQDAARQLQTCAKGTSNITMNNMALWMGGLVAGCGLDEAKATTILMMAAKVRRAENPEFFVPRGITDGKRQPRSFPFDNSEWMAPDWEIYTDNYDPIIDEFLANHEKQKGGKDDGTN